MVPGAICLTGPSVVEKLSSEALNVGRDVVRNKSNMKETITRLECAYVKALVTSSWIHDDDTVSID